MQRDPFSGVPSSEALQQARSLVMRFGRNATSYQILNPGISLWIADDGEAVVGYVTCYGFRVVAGAPICDDSRLGETLARFESESTAAGLHVCYFGAETRLQSHFRASSRHSMLRLGAQPAWNPALWAESLRHHASLRGQLSRARNKGVGVEEWTVEAASGHPQMQLSLDQWLATRGSPPMHFLVESQTLDRLYDRKIFVALRREAVVGFLIASPVPRRNGWLVEQIIRGAGAVNGTSELLVDAAMREAARAGSEYVTLGLSPLSVRGDDGSAAPPLWLRLLLGWVRAHGRRFYNFEGLDSFKAKMQPQGWEPIFAIANRPRFSPAVLYAVIGAFTGTSPIAATTGALAWALRQEARRLRPRPVSRPGSPAAR